MSTDGQRRMQAQRANRKRTKARKAQPVPPKAKTLMEIFSKEGGAEHKREWRPL